VSQVSRSWSLSSAVDPCTKRQRIVPFLISECVNSVLSPILTLHLKFCSVLLREDFIDFQIE